MKILIKTVRISGFRGLKNFEINLELTTVLTGMNNTGKTSFLKALQIALGNRQFISQDDFYISGNQKSSSIIIDIKIVSTDEMGNVIKDFSDLWEGTFTLERIRQDLDGNSFIPLRTIVNFDSLKNSFKTKQFILPDWSDFKDTNDKFWFEKENGNEKSFVFDEVPFFYMDAQRDIIEDIKIKSSYLGRMISKIEYKPEDIELIENKIKDLNEQAVNSSDILKNIKKTLKGLDTAMSSASDGVEITPFTKKIRDLNKGLSIYYNDSADSFSMEYHGMGTRSWSSLLTLKSFINLLAENAADKAFYPILAIEEPEAHLHPNAQKKLYTQISEIAGQKIISTHSSYIAASAKLNEIRNFYKENNGIVSGFVNTALLSSDGEDERKIRRQVINARGEIFFSKAIIFFEGETEEQALPIFAEKFFAGSNKAMTIDFVGVGGFGNYLPFIRVAEGLKIPWFIFSDAEDTPDKRIKDSVKNQFLACNSHRAEIEVIFFLNNNNDFEKQLVDDGFGDEIKKAIQILELPKCLSPQHIAAKTTEIQNYNNTKLYEIITGSKTQFGPVIAKTIIDSGKPLPPKIVELFNKVNEKL